jgi:hypothetical protein
LVVSLQCKVKAQSTDIYNNRVDNLTTKAHDFIMIFIIKFEMDSDMEWNNNLTKFMKIYNINNKRTRFGKFIELESKREIS